MVKLERITVEDERNSWARFYVMDGVVVVADTIDGKVIKLLDGCYIIGAYPSGEYRYRASLICADDKPVFRIRTFGSFAEARRFMSSLVLRGVTVKMRVIKASGLGSEAF